MELYGSIPSDSKGVADYSNPLVSDEAKNRLTWRSTQTLPRALASSFDPSDFRSPLICAACGSAGWLVSLGQTMLLTATLEPKNRKAWRDWLEHHHAKEKEIWLIFTKAHLGQRSFSYKDALSEAICFGWIDGVRQRIDNEKYAQRFSPRAKSSKWSLVNLSLAKELQAAGLLLPSGIASLNLAKSTRINPSDQSEPFPPAWFITAIQADPVALSNFQNLPPSHQRRYVGWISAAKRDDTRDKRISEAINLLRENKRLGLGPGEVRK